MRGKRYRDGLREDRPRPRPTTPAEAVALVKETAGAKFDETVELHLRLGVNVRHAEEQLRGTLALPEGPRQGRHRRRLRRGRPGPRGRPRPAPTTSARDDLAEKVEEGWTDFDVAIATPGDDAEGRQARPRARPAGQDAEPEGRHRHRRRRQGGRARRRPARSSTGPTARRSSTSRSARPASTSEALLENYAAVIEEIVRAKPAAAKGRYILSITLTTTMGPGIRVDTAKIRRRRDHGRRRPASSQRRRRGEAGEDASCRRGAAGGGGPPRLPRDNFCPKTAGGASQKSGAGGAEALAVEPACVRALFVPDADNNMNKEQKAAVVEELTEELKDAEAIFAIDYRGISVPQAAELRAGPARRRHPLPRRQEPAHPARRRRGGHRGHQGAPRGPDRARPRQGRRRAGRQDDLAGSAASGSCSSTRAG